MPNWWTANARRQSGDGDSDEFYDRAYEGATKKAAPTSDARTGEVFDASPKPARGWPFGRPSSS
ncbi:hypothetical protein [Kitasatospora cineracea]|uniref:Uncharacterized protein n=1 Tax=Kitasatospora cineracea TaxID=88074 RepID=A0A3N4RLS5_9ACTN|nr:hypothetical protein [Kitasatospora cineracea]RPE33746.1 hypothetical protein EDD38_2043 [Kitasatospora cineracea]